MTDCSPKGCSFNAVVSMYVKRYAPPAARAIVIASQPAAPSSPSNEADLAAMLAECLDHARGVDGLELRMDVRLVPGVCALNRASSTSLRGVERRLPPCRTSEVASSSVVNDNRGVCGATVTAD